MSHDLPELTAELRAQERAIIRSVTGRILPLLPRAIGSSRLRRNGYLGELLWEPMNYWRCLEVPLTAWALRPRPDDVVLDVSSPKLLALYLAMRGHRVITTDISDYFTRDLLQLRHELRLGTLGLALTAGQHLPFAPDTVDAAYAISVLEHIPLEGDSEVIAEIGRIIRPGGTFCMTVPFHAAYLEEFRPSLSWEQFSPRDERGVFFQRRHDAASLNDRLLSDERLRPELTVYLAERPLVEPGVGERGEFRENHAVLQGSIASRLASATMPGVRVPLLPVPLLRYLVQSRFSHRYHYLTDDPADGNVRAVFVRFRKQ